MFHHAEENIYFCGDVEKFFLSVSYASSFVVVNAFLRSDTTVVSNHDLTTHCSLYDLLQYDHYFASEELKTPRRKIQIFLHRRIQAEA